MPLLPKVKQEIECMAKMGEITKVTEPLDWCAGMVVVPGKVRICVDQTSRLIQSTSSNLQRIFAEN